MKIRTHLALFRSLSTWEEVIAFQAECYGKSKRRDIIRPVGAAKSLPPELATNMEIRYSQVGCSHPIKDGYAMSNDHVSPPESKAHMKLIGTDWLLGAFNQLYEAQDEASQTISVKQFEGMCRTLTFCQTWIKAKESKYTIHVTDQCKAFQSLKEEMRDNSSMRFRVTGALAQSVPLETAIPEVKFIIEQLEHLQKETLKGKAPIVAPPPSVSAEAQAASTAMVSLNLDMDVDATNECDEERIAKSKALFQEGKVVQCVDEAALKQNLLNWRQTSFAPDIVPVLVALVDCGGRAATTQSIKMLSRVTPADTLLRIVVLTGPEIAAVAGAANIVTTSFANMGKCEMRLTSREKARHHKSGSSRSI